MTLFDPVDHGGEYPEYSVANGTWNEERYRKRVEAAAAAIDETVPGGPDVVIAVEVENRRVLEDLAEALGGGYSVLASDREEAVLSCGILTRLPVLSFKAHLAVSPPESAGESVPRRMLEACVNAGGKRFYILAAHWKSKLGGAPETEPIRVQAALLARAVAQSIFLSDSNAALVLAGDLNENPDEWSRANREYRTALMPMEAGSGPWLLVSPERSKTRIHASPTEGAAAAGGYAWAFWDPWSETDGFSYRYEGEEERIDHILASPGLADGSSGLLLEAFWASSAGFLLDGRGSPWRWDSRSGEGYSDHLPVAARIVATSSLD